MRDQKTFWRETALVLEVAFAYALVQDVWQKLLPGDQWFFPFILSFLLVRSSLELLYDVIMERPQEEAVTPPPERLKDIGGLPPEVEDLREMPLDDVLVEIDGRRGAVQEGDRLYDVYTAVRNRVLSELGRRKSAAPGKA